MSTVLLVLFIVHYYLQLSNVRRIHGKRIDTIQDTHLFYKTPTSIMMWRTVSSIIMATAN